MFKIKYLILLVYSKKADYDAGIKDFKGKYFITPDYNEFLNNILDEKITAKKLVH